MLAALAQAVLQERVAVLFLATLRHARKRASPEELALLDRRHLMDGRARAGLPAFHVAFRSNDLARTRVVLYVVNVPAVLQRQRVRRCWRAGGTRVVLLEGCTRGVHVARFRGRVRRRGLAQRLFAAEQRALGDAKLDALPAEQRGRRWDRAILVQREERRDREVGRRPVDVYTGIALLCKGMEHVAGSDDRVLVYADGGIVARVVREEIVPGVAFPERLQGGRNVLQRRMSILDVPAVDVRHALAIASVGFCRVPRRVRIVKRGKGKRRGKRIHGWIVETR